MNTQQPTFDINEILLPWHQEILSRDAQRVYETVWFRMKLRNATTLYLKDEELSRRSRIIMQRIPAAQAELVRAGLLHIVPGTHDMRYEFVGADEDFQAEVE